MSTPECTRRLRDIAGLVLLSHALSFLQLCPAVAAAVPTPSVSVISEGEADFLSVTVNNASLRLLLSEIAARAGFELIELMPTERQVSVTYHKVPLDQALKQILQHEKLSFLFIYRDRKSAKLKRVLLIDARSQGTALPTGEPVERVPEETEGFSPDVPLEQILGWTTHRDPKIRTAALEALTLHPTDERAHIKLMEGIKDPDSNIRSVAIGLLGPFIPQWPEAEDAVMGALGDSEPSVRRLALLALWETSSSQISAALNAALRDNDPGIRDQARRFIDEMAIMENTPEH